MGNKRMRPLLLPLSLGVALAAGASCAETSDLDLAAIGPHAQVLVPRARLEIAGARIGWRIDDLRAAFRQAANDGLPVVVVAEGDDGGLFENVLRCPAFNTLAGQAHFILIPLPIADETSDAGRLVDALHMDPTFKSSIAVIVPRDRQAHELLRVTGYLDEAELIARLREAGFVTSVNPLPLQDIALGARPPRDCGS
jgi:hypothetical protein